MERRVSKNKTRRGFANAVRYQRGKVGYILLWLIGVPIPLLLLVYVLRGCT
jgi:hypothetical protein